MNNSGQSGQLNNWIDVVMAVADAEGMADEQVIETSPKDWICEYPALTVGCVRELRAWQERVKAAAAGHSLGEGWRVASSITGSMPEIGEPVLGYNPAWVDEDFNRNGVRECFLFGDGSEWQSARWDGYSDQWIVEDGAPTLWRQQPTPPNQERT